MSMDHGGLGIFWCTFRERKAPSPKERQFTHHLRCQPSETIGQVYDGASVLDPNPLELSIIVKECPLFMALSRPRNVRGTVARNFLYPRDSTLLSGSSKEEWQLDTVG
jgi:hypothetical protein